MTLSLGLPFFFLCWFLAGIWFIYHWTSHLGFNSSCSHAMLAPVIGTISCVGHANTEVEWRLQITSHLTTTRKLFSQTEIRYHFYQGSENHQVPTIKLKTTPSEQFLGFCKNLCSRLLQINFPGWMENSILEGALRSALWVKCLDSDLAYHKTVTYPWSQR